MVGALHKIVVKEVQERNGSLVRAGHGVEHLACFGAPVADETDAERAVKSAVAIRERFHAWRRQPA
jgi:class 3 adenylate cyclase